ncbi:hypothetical protein PCE31107_02750 [Pandoraea cepalis]|uniref:Uncharacterized protein n=1 Tax=Pandoraea cepalis TaxID=2508294 RepID=A0A5E4VLJ7_9BURK|nr:hypothetical protein PCE31107_02750 [Pandoraea cepalis]
MPQRSQASACVLFSRSYSDVGSYVVAHLRKFMKPLSAPFVLEAFAISGLTPSLPPEVISNAVAPMLVAAEAEFAVLPFSLMPGKFEALLAKGDT